MSFASVGTLGSASNKTSGTTVVITTGATAEAGNFVSVWTVWDNTQTTDGDSTNLSCTDSAGNTYAKAIEFTETVGVAADGLTYAIFTSVLGSQLTSGGTITVTSDTARVAKAASAWEFTVDEATVAVEATDAGGGTGGGAFSATLAGMTNQEYLLLGFMCYERGEHATLSFTQDSDYTSITFNSTAGGGANSNLSLFGGFRIATLTGDTYGVSVGLAAGECVHGLVAVYEESAGGTAHEMAGTASATSSATGVLRQGHVLAGTALGTSSSAGVLSQGHALSGQAVATSSATGALTLALVLAGQAIAASSATGSLDVPGQVDPSVFAGVNPFLFLLLFGGENCPSLVLPSETLQVKRPERS